MSNASISSRVTHTRRRSSDERANPGILLFTLQSLLRRCTNSPGAAKPQQKVGMSRAKAQRPQREKNDLSFRLKGEIFLRSFPCARDDGPAPSPGVRGVLARANLLRRRH